MNRRKLHGYGYGYLWLSVLVLVVLPVLVVLVVENLKQENKNRGIVEHLL